MSTARWLRERYQQRRQEAIALLGSQCKCGSVEDLEIDHIDPKTKTYKITDVLRCSEELFLTEIKKRQLLCASCHHKKTALELFCKDHPNEPYNIRIDSNGYKHCKTCDRIGGRRRARKRREKLAPII